jgi:hypothetical protein
MYHLPATSSHIEVGSEAGQIAHSLLSGRGFSDPFWWGKTGATAWLAPLYPLFLAAVFKIFGLYSYTSVWVILAVQSAWNAVLVRWIWEIGARCFSPKVGRWAGWIWALCPVSMIFAMTLVWDTAFTTALFTFALLLALRMRGIGGEGGYSWRRWMAWGAVWGTIGLCNPSMLIVLPFQGVWLLLGKDGAASGWTLRRKFMGAVAAGLIWATMLMPWWIRNERVFHTFIPMRGNLGVELCSGNCHGISGTLGQWDTPNVSWPAMAEYKRVGEVEYSRRQMQQFKSAFWADPIGYFKMMLMRMDSYWFYPVGPLGTLMEKYLGSTVYSIASLAGLLGAILAWRKRRPAAGLISSVLVLMPLLYYVVATQPRFRHSVEPLLCVLGVYVFQAAEMSFSVRWFSRRKLAPAAGSTADAYAPELVAARAV